MSRLEELMEAVKWNEFLQKKKSEDKKCDMALWILAGVGIAALVGGICYAIYRYMTPDYLEDFEDEFEDEEDIFEDEGED